MFDCDDCCDFSVYVNIERLLFIDIIHLNIYQLLMFTVIYIIYQYYLVI